MAEQPEEQQQQRRQEVTDEDRQRFESEIQKEGFRSLADNSEVKFRVAIGQRGLEARHITNLEGGEPEGHHVRPVGSHKEGKIRCYNCGALGHHTAKQCKKPRAEGKACYGCGSTEHQYADCPTTKERRERRGRTPQQ
ncbi:cold-shock DNA-binding domain-containing protein [Aphelenchoides avenae]|nr:cold-shock DNA-binding domain-containing protein [Aphelenchus avenae]